MVKKLLSLLCAVALVISIAPSARAYEMGEPYSFDLSGMIKDKERRTYAEMMLDYYLRNDGAVQEALSEGYCAVFLFEGCSDNMEDAELGDLSYYRVSAVCIALRLDSDGEPYIAYFNGHCSTLPDRPLAYGAWSLSGVGKVGPATVCDGTYEVYSVRHNGIYEALHLRTEYESDKIDAVYMTPEGYTTAQADKINIHTRTGNHIIQTGMWSAGCMLVGSGDYAEFTELMEATYYKVYEDFDIDRRVGTVTINRQMLKEEMYELYEDSDAVDMILAQSRQLLPEKYLKQCSEEESLVLRLKAARDTDLMTLPASNATDARSLAMLRIPKGEKVEILGGIRNSMGNLWYKAKFEDYQGYLYSEDTKELNWFDKLMDNLFG